MSGEEASGFKKVKHAINNPFSNIPFELNLCRYIMAWKKVEGSKVHDDLPSYQLPNGLLGHFYDRGSEFIDEATAAAATPPDQPMTLKGLLQTDLPPRTVLVELSTPTDNGDVAAIRPNPRLPPDPDCHTLDVSQPPRFFGDLRQHLPMVEAKIEFVHREEKDETRHKIDDRPPWQGRPRVTRVFADRLKRRLLTCGVRVMYTHTYIVVGQTLVVRELETVDG